MNILYVEDDPTVMAVAKSLFMRTEHSIIVCPTVQSAKVALTQCSAQIDVVITDIVLPGETGIDLLLFMSDRQIDIPVFVVSGFVMQHELDLKKYIDSGRVLRVYNKPYGVSDIITGLEELAKINA